jgi:hypothetical protein
METLELEPGEYEAAVERARVRADTEPHATAARYDKRLRMVMVTLHTGLTVAFRPVDVQGLETATVADLSVIEISPSGFGLHFPAIDADIWLPGLLAGHFGSKNWMAARLGKAGGKVRSPAKTAACRANGAKGGRPRKRAA